MKQSTEVSFTIPGSLTENQVDAIRFAVESEILSKCPIGLSVTVHVEEIADCPCYFCTAERKKAIQETKSIMDEALASIALDMRDIHRSAIWQEFVEILFCLCPDISKEELLSSWSQSI